MKLNIYLINLILLICIPLVSCTNETEIKPPNIILIMADDMGVETLNAYGGTSYETPNLDVLSANGILFENCISQPLCTPSRVKIMTGQYNYRNYEYFGYLGAKQKTFGNVLQEKGYATAIAGKWQLNGLAYQDELHDWNNNSKPNALGFDQYCLWQLTKMRKEGERFANPLIEQNGKVLPRNKDSYGPDIFSEFILDFIDQKKDQSFFVYYPMVLVHDPFVPTPDSESWKDEARRYENDTAYFGEMLTYTDKIVGKIKRKLEELNIDDNTIIIFTGDNGTHPSIYSNTVKGTVRGGKGNTTNAGTHVPLIVFWPDQIKKPIRYEGLVEFSDFYATFADIVGHSDRADGQSFLPLLKDQMTAPIRETVAVHYNPKWGKNVNRYKNQFIRNQTYKLYQDGSFYHLKTDELEQHNLPIDSLTTDQLDIRNSLATEMTKHPNWIEK